MVQNYLWYPGPHALSTSLSSLAHRPKHYLLAQHLPLHLQRDFRLVVGYLSLLLEHDHDWRPTECVLSDRGSVLECGLRKKLAFSTVCALVALEIVPGFWRRQKQALCVYPAGGEALEEVGLNDASGPALAWAHGGAKQCHGVQLGFWRLLPPDCVRTHRHRLRRRSVSQSFRVWTQMHAPVSARVPSRVGVRVLSGVVAAQDVECGLLPPVHGLAELLDLGFVPGFVRPPRPPLQDQPLPYSTSPGPLASGFLLVHRGDEFTSLPQYLSGT